jgi:hypothetical protein
MLSRKYYKGFANIFSSETDAEKIKTRTMDFFASDNPRFSREKFMKASKMKQGIFRL